MTTGKTHFVYMTVNNTNEKFYVGMHKGYVDDAYLGSGTALQSAIEKYGVDAFEREIISVVDSIEDAFALEAQIVTESFVDRKDTYNMKVGGVGGFDHINDNPLKRARATEMTRVAMTSKSDELASINAKKANKGANNYWFGRDRSGVNNPRTGVKVDREVVNKVTKARMESFERGEWNMKGKGGAKTQEGRDKIASANARQFVVVNPEGETVTTTNMAAFCRDNKDLGLVEHGFREMAKGKRKSYKGWTRGI